VTARTCSDTDDGVVDPGDVATADPEVTSYVVPVIAGVFAVGLNLFRANQGLARTLGESLTPAELIAYDRNPLLNVVGFPSGSELTAVSLPLRGYQLFDDLGIGVLDATRAMIAFETLWMFVVVAWAVRVARPTVSRNIAACAALVACLGYVLAGNNLANWGFLWGWNYGFAYSVVCLLVAFALRGRWTAAAVAAAVLVTIHSVVGVLAVIVVLPLLAIDLVGRRVHVRWLVVAGAAVMSGAYLAIVRGDVPLGGEELDTAAYVARLRAFQSHLFYEFDLEFLRPLAQDIGAWAVGVLFLIVVVALLRSDGESDFGNRVLIVMTVIPVLAMIGWAYSTIDQPNPAILLLAIHRTSVFTNLLVLFVGVPVLIGQLRAGRRLATTTTIVVWMLVPASSVKVALGLLCTALLLLWFVVVARDREAGSTRWLGIPALLAACAATFFLVVAAESTHGSMMEFVSETLASTGMAWFLLAVGLLGLAPALSSRWRIRSFSGQHVAAMIVFVASCLGVALVMGSEAVDNPLEIDGAPGELRDDLLEVQRWARSATAPDANFLLPLDSFGFGWRVFSERASAGKPHEWLHYSFLYSRDQNLLEEGTRRANLLGLDVDAWLVDHPELRTGLELVAQLDARYEALSDLELIEFADQLDADFIVFDNTSRRGSACFDEVFANEGFWVATVSDECRVER
jgi:hypothetical protein